MNPETTRTDVEPPLINDTITEQMEAGPTVIYTRTEAVIIGFILVAFAILTIFGNILVIGAIIISRDLKTKTMYFIVSLAVADMLVGVIVMPYMIYFQLNNLILDFDDSICKLLNSLDIMLTSTSIYHLLCIAVDRYIAICMPFHYHNLTKKIILVLLVGCWMIPISYSFLPIYLEWNLIGIEELYSKVTSQSNSCVVLLNVPFVVITSIILFFLPMIAVIGMYAKIYHVAIKQSNQIAALNAQVNAEEQKDVKRENKATKTLMLIVGVFLVCWLPFSIFNFIYTLTGYQIPLAPWMVVIWLGYINSMLNPWVYYASNSKFRSAYKYMLSCGKITPVQGGQNTTTY